jgi:3-hydroxybutyryl-CoA dehydrogenase
MVEKGKVGLKTGKGFYNWTPEYTKRWRAKMEKNLVSYLKKED